MSKKAKIDEDLKICPGDPNDEKATCGGELKFDPDLVGDTCGGLTLRGWMVCQKCGQAWIAPKGMAVSYDGVWKLAKGGRSVETGNGRIRVDGGTNVEALMARIVKLPDLELEVAKLRKELEAKSATPALDALDPVGGQAHRLFRDLQHRVYSALVASHDEEGWSGTIEEAREILTKAGFENIDSHETVSAIQYAVKYGRMP